MLVPKTGQMQRRILSRRQLILGAGATTLLAGVDAFCLEPRWLRVTEHDVPVAKLPRNLDGYRMAQVTDAHLRNIGLVEEAIIGEIRRQNVGLVVLTGDMIDNPFRLPVLEEFCEGLRDNRRTVLATLGNWENWARIPLEFLRTKYRACRVNLVVNQSALVDSAVVVIATDDSTGGTVRVNEAISGRSVAAASFFLMHSPELLDRLPETLGQFDLALAGHTHGGQGRIGTLAPLRPPGSGRFVQAGTTSPLVKHM